MKKLFNIRLPLLYALMLVAGIVFATVAEYFKFSSLWTLAPVALTLCVCVFIGIKLKKARSVLLLISVAAVFAAGALYTSALIFNYCNKDVFIDSAVMIYGRVSEVGLTSKGTRFIVIENVRFGETYVNGKLIAYFLEDAGEFCRRGYQVSFYSQPEAFSFISQGSVNYYAACGVKYSCVVAGSLQAKYSFSLFGEIAYAIEQMLYSNLDAETASVALALLTGNADMISSGTIAAFRGGGIAHVFAVSGLHIGVIYAVVSAILKKIPLNRFVSAVIRIIFVFLFAGVCNFTPSSVRAAIMCSVTATASCLYRRYDSLNGISVAAIILLLINPLSLFEVGFALSFGAVLGIIFLYRRFYSAFRFLPKRLCGGIASGWSAQFATIPVLLSSFGYVSWAGIVLNLIFIPIISALYLALFAVTAICFILPFCAPVLLGVTTVPLQFIINIIVSSGVENAVIFGDFGMWIYIPFIVVMLALTDKVNLKNGVRCALVGLTCFIVICLTVTPSYGKGTSISFAAGTDGGYAYLSNGQGSVLIVTQNVDGVPNYVTQNADALLIVGGDDEGLAAMINLGGGFDRIYLKGSSASLPPLGNYYVTYSDSFTECGMEFKFEDDALYIDCGGTVTAIVYNDKGEEYGNLPKNCSLCLYAYANNDPVLFTASESYNLSYCGKMKFNASYGKLTPQYAVPKE
ncbi:MAG: ComEC/Rec2 family competence protein [Candidatus Coproplasma sp.]